METLGSPRGTRLFSSLPRKSKSSFLFRFSFLPFFPPHYFKTHFISRPRYALLIRYNASVFVFRFARGNFDEAYIIRRRRRRKFSRIQYRARSPSRPVPDSFDLAEPRFSLVIFERVCRHVVSDSSTVFLSLLLSLFLARGVRRFERKPCTANGYKMAVGRPSGRT